MSAVKRLPKVDLTHHWLVSMRGGEKVLEQFCLLFPESTITMLVADKSRLEGAIRSAPVRTSFLQAIGGARYYKKMLPLFPLAAGSLTVGCGASLVLSSDASVIKGFRLAPGVPQVCYCHSPPRYLWDLQETYERNTSEMNALARLAFRATVPFVRNFDRRAASSVTNFIANSEFVRARIREFYGRDATVVHPPVDVAAFDPGLPRSDSYLVVSHLVPYKRIDIAVDAFNQLGRPLTIIGEGSEFNALKSRAQPNIRFLGSRPFEELKRHYETCRAFIFPGIEDFGITPLEAQAAGAPVIAFRAGGALETVVENKTGLFFDEQTPQALAGAVHDFERKAAMFDPARARENAVRFGPGRFRQEIKAFLCREFPGLFMDYPWPV
jgi:glycosyltransferase involved in cell wall biosynthesis